PHPPPPPPDSGNLEPSLDATVGLPAAFADALSVHPAPALLAELAPGIAANLAALRKLRDADNNLLLADPALATERVDSTAFYAASLQAAAEALSLLDNKVDAQWHEGLAERCRQALLGLLWCEWSDFFCDLAQESNLPLETPQTRSLLPFALGLVPDDPQYNAALEVLVDPKALWTPYPVAEVTLDTASGGTVRPDLNAMVADVMAAAIRNRRQDVLDRLRLRQFVDLYARLMCEEADPARPQTRQSYDAQTGQGDGALDVFIDAFNDLVLRHLIGLVPQPDDTLVVDPLAHGWRHFRADDVPYRGHLVTVIWESRPEGERYPDAVAGLTVRVDGQLVAQSPQLEKIVADLPQH
ncbi:MAG: MGH1-like glycoside hydrolase domain-containing protein, partial [Armatimonadota bacterium]